MIALETYINENGRTTNNNAERKHELEEYLKGKKYTDYVNTLNKMLEDPKAAALLKDGFGGELGNMKLRYAVKYISANALRPTQSEIDISKSLKHGLTKVENINKDFDEPVELNEMPVITFRGNYIIDGHHRWVEPAILNPSAKLICFDYDGDISPIQMLKAVQGVIAAVMADKDGKLPISRMKDKNIYDMSEKQIRKYVEDNISDAVVMELIKRYKVNDRKSVIDKIIDNIISLKANNYPETGMPNRGEMPQVDKAGTNKNDKETAKPNNDGSALNKLKDGKIDREAIS